MFENVFGYDQNYRQQQAHQEEVKHGNLPMQSISTPYVAAGYENNSFIGGYISDSSSNFKDVVLE